MLKSCIFKALALYHLDKPKEALSFYNQSLELDPNDAKTYFNYRFGSIFFIIFLFINYIIIFNVIIGMFYYFYKAELMTRLDGINTD